MRDLRKWRVDNVISCYLPLFIHITWLQTWRLCRYHLGLFTHPHWECSCGLKRRRKITQTSCISSVLPVSADLFGSRFQLLIWGSRIIWPWWCNKLERWSLSNGHLGPTTPRARHLIWFCWKRLFSVTWNAVFVPICSKWAVISEQWAVRQTLKTNVAINTHRLPSASLTELVVT